MLGVTNGDWEELAFAALEDLELDIARLAFIKLQEYNYLELIRNIQVGGYKQFVIIYQQFINFSVNIGKTTER